MSTYLTRIVEVKDNDGNWKIVEWHTPNDNGELEMHDHYYNNACIYREVLRDSDYSDRGIPSDCSERTKAIIEKHKPYAYGHTYMTFSELDSFCNKMRDEVINSIIKEHDKEQFEIINEKLDCILDGKKYKTKKKEDDEYNDEDYSMLNYYMGERFNDFLSLDSECAAIYFIASEFLQSYASYEGTRVIYYYE